MKNPLGSSPIPLARLAGSLLLLLPLACAPGEGGRSRQGDLTVSVSDDVVERAAATLTEEDLVRHIQVLASDEFQGRAPSSPGEEKTMAYLVEQFSALGLEPGGPDGSWFQEVPLVSITADPQMTLTVSGRGGDRKFAYRTDFVAGTRRVVDRIDLQGSELVFVGYGAVAPEYDWNDFEGVDVRGKTILVLVNDPGFATRDPALFKGNTMTYYGRWTYKFEEAARQGAAGVFVIHETEPAAYGWATVQNSWTGPQFHLVASDNNMGRALVEGWITLETAQAIFAQAGLSFEELKAKASTREFQAVPLGLEASLSFRNTLDRSTSRNFLAKIPGTRRPEEVVLYMAHWDHFGMNPSLSGDQIFNGARDNASGVAAMLEIAEAFKALQPGPERTVVFLATTAEEQGLLGSAYYAEAPVYPPALTVAAINLDGLAIFGPTRDYVVIGYGNSTLDNYVVRFNESLGRVVKPDPEPEKGFFYRSDHFPLAKIGIPSHYGSAGHDHVEKGEEWGKAQSDRWTAERYHQPSDEYSEDWDLGGALQDLKVWFRLGVALAYSSDWPTWNEGTEFKAIREASTSALRTPR